MNFWKTLKKPFLVQAPMEDVTDVVFREMIARCGKPDVFFTEFTNTDGLLSKGKEKVIKRLAYKEDQRPIVAQIWGNNPESNFKVSKMLVEMGFDGIDLNMGCPVKTVVKKGCCAGLIRTPSLAKELILATQEGAGEIPVSVKTRLGYNTFVTEDWVGFLLKETKIAALTLHGRIATRMSKDLANWDEIGKAVEMRDELKSETVIIGNGDVNSYQDAMDKHTQYKVDGIMIGRGMFHNLWIFNPQIDPTKIPTKEKLQLLIDHISLFEKTWGETKYFDIMKKYYKIYVSEMEDASILRTKLMEFKNAEDTIQYLAKIVEKLPVEHE